MQTKLKLKLYWSSSAGKARKVVVAAWGRQQQVQLRNSAADLGLARTKAGKGQAGGKADGFAVALGGDGWIGQIHIEQIYRHRQILY